MFDRVTLSCTVLVLVTAGAMVSGQHVVDLSLLSNQAGTNVSPGANIDWEISALITGGSSLGLALVSSDLKPGVENPEPIAFGAAQSVPAGMAAFAKPDGVTNPGVDAAQGYGGTLGNGALLQIGGGQNTTGAVAVAQGVGLGPQGQLIAEGSFPAPNTAGTYRVELASPIANVLTAVNVGAASPVVPATITTGTSDFSFTVGSTCACGDLSGEGAVDLLDFATFITCYALPGPGGGCNAGRYECADFNGDAAIDLLDFATFVRVFGLPASGSPPNC